MGFLGIVTFSADSDFSEFVEDGVSKGLLDSVCSGVVCFSAGSEDSGPGVPSLSFLDSTPSLSTDGPPLPTWLTKSLSSSS